MRRLYFIAHALKSTHFWIYCVPNSLLEHVDTQHRAFRSLWHLYVIFNRTGRAALSEKVLVPPAMHASLPILTTTSAGKLFMYKLLSQWESHLIWLNPIYQHHVYVEMFSLTLISVENVGETEMFCENWISAFTLLVYIYWHAIRSLTISTCPSCRVKWHVGR